VSARSALKTAIESAATGLGLARAAAYVNRDAAAILSYHNIVPDGESAVGDRSLHLPIQAFRDQLDVLEANYEIVGLDSLGDRHEGTAPRVAITFDDAYAGAVCAGVAELARRGLPATIFVSNGMLNRRSFWWDRLAAESGAVAAEVREHALWQLGGADEAIRAWVVAEGMPERDLPEHALSTTKDELAAAIDGLDVTIGAHGSGHLNMAALGASDLAHELRAPAEALAQDFTSYRPWVAYPYGLTSHAVEAAAGQYYRLGFRIEGGLARRNSTAVRPRAVARINVPAGLSPRGLRLRISGLIS
jgi:peptidoglycan/xylan/chitin deacetylase (PgdA/CDA1 family)